MTYPECLEFLFSQLPMYQKIGDKALKKSLDNIQKLCHHLGHPQNDFQSVHVAGTNGKGSSCHALAAVLQTAGYKTGLYTSPHIKDFRERIRVNGAPIGEDEVVDFVAVNYHQIEKIAPSFFEITVAMAFKHFSDQRVDIAVVEVGLGGRLDSTNIIYPLVSLITNIGYDHQSILGNTLRDIAREKAGIIKPLVPVVIGERHPETDEVFELQAGKNQAPLYFAHDHFKVRVLASQPTLKMEVYQNGQQRWDELIFQLNGPYQPQNIPGILHTLSILGEAGFKCDDMKIKQALANITEITGIKGRWQVIGKEPLIICDTGHNRAAMEYIVAQLLNITRNRLHMILGFVNDKDIRSMLELLPNDACYYFCSAGVPRSLPAHDLANIAKEFGITGEVIPDPNEALSQALAKAQQLDVIFVGGSTFVVAELREI